MPEAKIEKVEKVEKVRIKKQYTIPETLESLLQEKPEDFDFALACLLISRYSIKETFAKDVDIEKWLHELDNIVVDIQENINDTQTPEQVVKAIAHHLYDVLRFVSSQNGWDHSNLYLSLILEGRQGYCLGFVGLWLALAQRLRYQGKPLPMYGVSIPQHVFARWDDGETKINIETLHIPKYSKDPRKKLLQLLQESDRLEQIPAQNISDEEYIERYQISPQAISNKLYLQNLTPRQVLAYIYYNRSSLNRDEVERLKYSMERTTIMKRVHRDVRLSIKLNPLDIDCIRLLAISNLAFEQNYEQAIVNFEKCLQLEKSLSSYILITQACISTAQYKKAFAYIDKAYDLKERGEDITDLTMMEAEVYYASGKYRKAIELCDAYLKSHNTTLHFFSNLSLILIKIRCYRELGEYDNAYSLAQFLVDTEIEDYYVNTYPQMGIILAMMGEKQQANEFFDKTLKIEYQTGDAFYGKAIIALQEKQYQQALKYLEEAVCYDSINVDISRMLQVVRQKLSKEK